MTGFFSSSLHEREKDNVEATSTEMTEEKLRLTCLSEHQHSTKSSVHQGSDFSFREFALRKVFQLTTISVDVVLPFANSFLLDDTRGLFTGRTLLISSPLLLLLFRRHLIKNSSVIMTNEIISNTFKVTRRNCSTSPWNCCPVNWRTCST